MADSDGRVVIAIDTDSKEFEKGVQNVNANLSKTEKKAEEVQQALNATSDTNLKVAADQVKEVNSALSQMAQRATTATEILNNQDRSETWLRDLSEKIKALDSDLLSLEKEAKKIDKAMRDAQKSGIDTASLEQLKYKNLQDQIAGATAKLHDLQEMEKIANDDGSSDWTARRIAITETETALSNLNARLNELNGTSSQTTASQKQQIDLYKQISNEIVGYDSKLNDNRAKLNEINSTINKAQNSHLNYAEAMEINRQKASALSNISDELKSKYSALASKAEEMKKALALGNITQSQYDEFQRTLIQTRLELSNLNKQADEYGNTIKSLGEDTVAFGDKFKANLTSEAIVDADDTPFRRAMEDISKSVANVLSLCAKAAAAASAVASAAAVAMAKSAVDSFAEYEQLVGGVETLFKDSSETVKQYANNAYQSAGLSANAYMETVTSFSASLLQGLGGDTAAAAEIANRAIIDMSDNANKMGTDILLIQNAYQGFAKQNYTMLDNLKLGYGGTQAEMARLINESKVLGDTITVTAETVNQVSFDKIIEAIHIIQENIGITGTTSEESAETIQGSAASMEAAWQNLLTGMADPTQDYSALINNLVDTVSAFADNIVPRIDVVLPQMAAGLNNVVGELLPKLLETIDALLPKMIEGVNVLVTALIDTLTTSLFAFAPIISENAEKLIDVFINGVIGSLPAIAGAAAEIVLGLAEDLLDSENISAIVNSAVELITALSGALSESLPTLLPVAVNAVITLADEIIKNVDKMYDAAEKIMSSLADGLVNSIPVLLEAAPVIVLDLFTALIRAIPKALLFPQVFCERIAEGIAEYDWDTIGLNMYKGITDALARALNGEDYAEKRAQEQAQKIASYGDISAEEITNTISNLQQKISEYNGFLNKIAEEGYVTEELYNSLPEGIRRGAEAMGISVQEYLNQMISDAESQISTLTDVYSQIDETANSRKPTGFVYTPNKAEEEYWKRYGDTAKGAIGETNEAIKNLTEDEAENLHYLAEIDKESGAITETAYYDRVAAIAAQLDKETELYKKYNLEVAKGRASLREELDKQAQADRKQAENNYEATVKDAMSQIERTAQEQGLGADWERDRLKELADSLEYGSDLYFEVYDKYLDKRDEYAQEENRRIEETRKEAERQAEENKKQAQDLLKNEVGDIKSNLDDLINTYESGYNEIIKSRDAYKKKLMGGSIFSVTTEKDAETGEEITTYSIDNLKKRLKAQQEYVEQMSALRKRGLANGLMTELEGLDKEQAMVFARQLNKMSDEEFKELNESYNQLDEATTKAAAERYQGDIDSLQTGFIDKAKELFDGLSPELEAAGMNSLQAFITGFEMSKENAFKELEDFTDDIVSKINSGIADGTVDLSQTIESIVAETNIGDTLCDNLLNSIIDNHDKLAAAIQAIFDSTGLDMQIKASMESSAAAISAMGYNAAEVIYVNQNQPGNTMKTATRGQPVQPQNQPVYLVLNNDGTRIIAQAVNSVNRRNALEGGT